jgi:cytochrome d ubiquinol oxidase subunit I
VLLSLLCYIIAYAIIFPSGWIVMSRIVRHGPEAMVAEDDEVESGRPGHPITELPTSRAGTAVR